jgi:hypothetical protein
VKASVRALAQDDRVPSRVVVAGRQVNAAQFLYLMAKIVAGASEAEAPPLVMWPPVESRDKRSRDTLSLLQMWTYKPAYFGALGGRPQKMIGEN